MPHFHKVIQCKLTGQLKAYEWPEEFANIFSVSEDHFILSLLLTLVLIVVPRGYKILFRDEVQIQPAAAGS